MKTITRRFVLKVVSTCLVLALSSVSVAQAAKTVAWDDLRWEIGVGKTRFDGGEARQYRVVTKTGETFVGHRLIFTPGDVSIDSTTVISRSDVAEVRIRRDEPLRDALITPAAPAIVAMVFGYDQPHLKFILVPIAAVAVAAGAPIMLPIYGVKKLLPDRVIKVAP